MPIDLNEGVDAQFKVQRQRAAQGEAGALQRQRDAMARRSAQLGGGPSGALIKQEGVAADQSAQRLQSVNEGIDAAQTGEHRRVREIQQGQEFVRGERLGGQEFSAGESAINRKYGTSEREAGQAFHTSERLGSQDFAENTRVRQNQFTHQSNTALADQAIQETRLAQHIQGSQFQASMDRDWAKFQHEVDVDDFNMRMANKMANEKDPLEQLLAGGGMNGGGLKGALGGGLIGGPTGSLLGGGGKSKYKFGAGGAGGGRRIKF